MSETENHPNRLTGEQILTLLELTLESQVADEFQRLVGLTSAELLRETHERLESNRLGLTQAARLLAVNELTLKSWLKSSKPLAEIVHQKLAGLCLVLSLPEAFPGDSESANLVRAAVSAVRNGTRGTTIDLGEESVDLVLAAFDAVGLMAAALHSALKARPAENASQGEKGLQR